MLKGRKGTPGKCVCDVLQAGVQFSAVILWNCTCLAISKATVIIFQACRFNCSGRCVCSYVGAAADSPCHRRRTRKWRSCEQQETKWQEWMSLHLYCKQFECHFSTFRTDCPSTSPFFLFFPELVWLPTSLCQVILFYLFYKVGWAWSTDNVTDTFFICCFLILCCERHYGLEHKLEVSNSTTLEICESGHLTDVNLLVC